MAKSWLLDSLVCIACLSGTGGKQAFAAFWTNGSYAERSVNSQQLSLRLTFSSSLAS